MTAIAAIAQNGKVWIGGDSAGVDTGDYSLNIRKDEKVFINRQFIMGFTSSFRMGNLLRYSFVPPKFKKNVLNDGSALVAYMNTAFISSIRECFGGGGFTPTRDGQVDGGVFIVGFNGNLFVIQGDFQVAIPTDNYAACGCGKQICLGSLHATGNDIVGGNWKFNPEQRIKLALQAAEHFSAGVRGPFVIKSL